MEQQQQRRRRRRSDRRSSSLSSFSSDEVIAEAAHRQRVGKLIHFVWSSSGTDSSGLAAPLLDGRVDLLGAYATLSPETFNEDEDDASSSSSSSSRFGDVAIVDADDLSYADFFRNHMEANVPVLIRGLTKGWRIAKEWTIDEDEEGRGGGVNLEFLRRSFGDEVVPVHVQDGKGFGRSRPRTTETTVAEYADWWRARRESAKENEGENNHGGSATTTTRADNDDELHYLKDWNFAAKHPDYGLYECPVFFRDDWLNEHYDDHDGDDDHDDRSSYRFVYLGPAGTSTRLHADVLFSYSWSTNVCGIKRWYLVPPDRTHLLRDCFGTRLAGHFRDRVDVDDDVLFPGLARARTGGRVLEVVQRAGETIFVPSGWYHTVENTEDALSVNHNWINGTNVRHSWDKVRSEMENAVENSDDEKTNNNECSQLDNDALLLWKMVSRKAERILSSSVGGKNHDDQNNYDLRAALPVLEGIDGIVERGMDHGVVGSRDDYGGKDLIRRVRDELATKAQSRSS